ncbi:MAG: hypothetical protein GC154_20840 [bacterium]|nr:hypothetical protein [bacterium]
MGYRIRKTRILLSALLMLAACHAAPYCDEENAANPAPVGAAFAHPGLLHTRADLERMRVKAAAKAEPWYAGFLLLKDHPQSSAEWKTRGGFERVSRDRNDNTHNADLWQDANAAYQNALMWAITGEQAHARKAIEILNAWASELKTIEGHDKQLAAGLYGFKLANAAEIMLHTDSGWTDADAGRFRAMLMDVFYPVIRNFATFANGNWDGACLKMMMATGVFCDDREIFDRAVDYLNHGEGNGRLTHYVINEAGQCQESGRDQQHTQLGLALLAETCEMGWNQGLDLYGANENRLLKGFEYTAKYNLGYDVPFVSYTDTTGKYVHERISEKGRGRLRPIYEMALNHYAVRRGLNAPYTRRAAESIRPEGAAFQADHPGFGTLLFTR